MHFLWNIKSDFFFWILNFALFFGFVFSFECNLHLNLLLIYFGLFCFESFHFVSFHCVAFRLVLFNFRAFHKVDGILPSRLHTRTAVCHICRSLPPLPPSSPLPPLPQLLLLQAAVVVGGNSRQAGRAERETEIERGEKGQCLSQFSVLSLNSRFSVNRRR